MRAGIVVACLVLWASIARGETVLVMSGGAEQESALRVAMAGRGVAVASAPGPLASLRLERAAIAQRTAYETGAVAAVWLDDTDVCVVTADGQQFRNAPLPPDVATPRAFAAIATSLLDEMLRPEAWAEGFDVNVNVEVTPRGGAAPMAFAAPGLVDAVDVRSSEERAHQGQTLLEIGGMLSPISGGISGAVMFPLSPAWRIGVNGSMNEAWVDGGVPLAMFGAELRHVGLRHGRKHWDIGPETGMITDGHEPVYMAGVRFARTVELESTAVSLSFTPLALIAPGGDAIVPGIISTLRWQVPL